ncbi:hypothetical protein C4568_00580, partial [Candidatus Parcubacteria bacterium]
MVFSRRRILQGAGALASSLALPAWAAFEPWTEISTTVVYLYDPVKAAEGVRALGDVRYAKGDRKTTHLFVSAETAARYEKKPSLYPDLEAGVELTMRGADVVHLSPEGVRVDVEGKVVTGDPTRFLYEYDGTPFAFAEAATLAAFKADPEKYMSPFGNRCPGAVSIDDGYDTPSDPRRRFFIHEFSVVGYFGSPNGPEVW